MTLPKPWLALLELQNERVVTRSFFFAVVNCGFGKRGTERTTSKIEADG